MPKPKEVLKKYARVERAMCRLSRKTKGGDLRRRYLGPWLLGARARATELFGLLPAGVRSTCPYPSNSQNSFFWLAGLVALDSLYKDLPEPSGDRSETP